jgi:hypothetical protein
MSTEEKQRNLVKIVRATALECAEPRATFILPWRMDANEDRLHESLEECGCGFCPDDDQETTKRR